MARERKRTAEIAWLERTNPLQGLSIRDAQAIFDAARQGDTQRLHWLFQEVEAVNPVLLTCVERRASAISGFQWNVSARPSAKDDALADEQRSAAADFLAGIENLTEAIEHLDLAFFRGFSHVQPVWLDDGTVRDIYLPESWTFLRRNGVWYHNPLCTGFNTDAQDCTDARLVTIVRRRPIDYPALSIHVRAAVGKRDWGRFIERYALPKPAVFMHPGATGEQKSDYLEGAQAVENGQVSVWPNGASLTDFAGGSRGTDPFSSFIEYQDRQVVLLATGGTLTSLAQADTGSLAGGAQMDVWKEIVARDASVVAAAVNRGLVRPFLEAKFPGRPVEADFVFETAKRPTAKEVAEVASTLKNAGYVIVQDELEEAVGFTLEKAPEQSPAPGGLPFMNKGPSAPPLKTLSKPLKTASGNPDGQGEGEDGRALLEAFSRDTGPAASAIRELLDDPTPEKAKRLLGELNSLIPSDPALAAVIAEAMAAEFASITSQPSPKSQPSQNAPLANKTDANGMEHAESGEGGGQFVKKDDGSSGGQPVQESAKAKAKREKHEWQTKASAQGNASMARVLSGEDVIDFMPGLTLSGGKKISHIAFYQSEHIHVRDHVQGDFGGGKIGYNHQPMLENGNIPTTITQGTWYKQGADYAIVNGNDKIVILVPDGPTGLKFKTARIDSDGVKDIRAGKYQRVFNKEDADDESHSTTAGL